MGIAGVVRPLGGLVGRDAELDLLRTFVGEGTRGGGALVLSGDPGIGKTALLDEAAAVAAAADVPVLRASGIEFEADLGFAGLNQLLLPLADRLAGLPPAQRDALAIVLGLTTSADAPDRLMIFTAALGLLRDSAARTGLLVLVDDAPWLDRASAAALGFVARRLTGSRVALLIAGRPGSGAFPDRAGLPTHEVLPLPEDAAEELLRAGFPDLAPRARRRVLADARGNPLALLELPAALDSRWLSTGRPLPAALPLTGRLSELFASRIAELPTATRHLLLLAALDGTGELSVLQAAGPAGLADLDPAERAGLVYLDGPTRRLRFRHPLIRSAVVAPTGLAERRAAHRRLADALADEPERSAWHLAEATVEPDDDVAARLERAAQSVLARGDAGTAMTALLRAAELSPRTRDRARRCASAAYLGAQMAGELRGAVELLSQARPDDPSDAVSLQAAVAASFVLLNEDGDLDTAYRLIVGAVRTWNADDGSGADAARAALIEALHTLISICMFIGRPELWAPLHEAVAAVPPPVPEPLALCSVTFADPLSAGPGHLARVDAAVAGLDGAADPAHVSRVGMAAVYVDRQAGCRTALTRVSELGRTGRAVMHAINASLILTFDDFLTGNWDRAQSLGEECLETCRTHGYHLMAWTTRYKLGLLAAARGDERAGADLAEEMRAPTATRRILYFHHVRCLAALGRADFEDAYRNAAAMARPGHLPSHTPHVLWVCMDLVEAAVRTGRLAEARAHVAELRRAGVERISPRLALLAGGAAGLAAPDAEFVAIFERALAIPEGPGWPFEHARVRLAYGERLRRVRAPAARDHLAAALATFERLGARPWTVRAAGELRAAGTGPLTAQERQIAALAAGGLTNKEIGARLSLSHRTVSSHLYRIFPKLGVATRAALRDALAALPAED
ncbi:putative HTH-type transcriptional regulator [Actinomadura rubteroloni]|uniref:Putative HTH-type transcriptional regulator n=1 Tax=Actinomadura rubteroloni TaxID=1926885 RepID=A0A2P4UEU6_9ACTN|nr:LuxR family transcriptional regulator [Actinomadura rubteroloni]POM23594.1 putative HTH-type transcriptional regulator [Actinomadura rubteroloni]